MPHVGLRWINPFQIMGLCGVSSERFASDMMKNPFGAMGTSNQLGLLAYWDRLGKRDWKKCNKMVNCSLISQPPMFSAPDTTPNKAPTGSPQSGLLVLKGALYSFRLKSPWRSAVSNSIGCTTRINYLNDQHVYIILKFSLCRKALWNHFGCKMYEVDKRCHGNPAEIWKFW